MTRKIVVILSVLTLILFVSVSAFAVTGYTFSSGTCCKAFKTTNYLSMPANSSWSKYSVSVHTLNYRTSSGSLSYLKARAISSDGSALYSTKKKVYLGSTTEFTPINDGPSATVVRFKIHNAYYDEDGISTINMSSSGIVTGTLG